MTCRRIFASVLLVTVAAVSGLRAQPPVTLTVDVNQPKAPVSPTLFGLMTEEIMGLRNFLQDTEAMEKEMMNLSSL